MDSRKKFQQLTIRDNFMFAAVMVQEDNCKHFLEILLGIEIREVKVSYEKCLIYNPEYKGVRLDVYVNDVSRSIFLSTKGRDEEHIPKELKAFLDFIRQDTPQNNTETDDEYVKVLQKTIRRVKENRELERSFMTLDEYRQWGKAEGYAEGHAEGLAEGHAEGHAEGLTEGMLRARREDIVRFLQKLEDIPDSLSARIVSETDMDVLNAMLDAAVSTASIEEFEKKCSNL